MADPVERTEGTPAVEAPAADATAVEAESNDAFEAGFAGTPATASPAEPEKKAEGQEPPKAEEPEKKEPAPDPWAGVPEVVKTQLESVSSKLAIVDRLPDRLRNIEGHIGGLTSQLKTALETAKAVEKTGGDAPTQAQIDAAAGSSEKWKRIKDDYPEWADAMEERLAALAPKPVPTGDFISKADFENTLKQVDERFASEAAARRAEQEEWIEDRHAGWKDTVKTPEFEAWFNAQPAETKLLAKSTRVRDAVKMLDAYKAAKTVAAEKDKSEKDQKDKELRSAVPAQGVVGRTGATPIDDDAAFGAGFEAVRPGG